MSDPDYMKQRLRKLQDKPGWAFRPLDEEFLRKTEPSEKRLQTEETEMQQKVDKAMKRIDEIKDKMKNSSNYLSLYYDLKKAQDNFLALVEELNSDKFLDFPESFLKRVEIFKSKLRTVR